MYTKHIRSPLHTQHTEKNVKLIQIFNYPPLTLTHQGDHKKKSKTGSNIFPSPLPPPALAFASDDVDFGNKLSDCDVVTLFWGGGGQGVHLIIIISKRHLYIDILSHIFLGKSQKLHYGGYSLSMKYFKLKKDILK